MVAESKHQVKKLRAAKRRMAFALGGGGARGALQAGALRALLEAGIRPDLLAGTSIGAVNAVFLAMHGFTPQALDELDHARLAATQAKLLPANMAWLTVRVFFNRVRVYPHTRIREFFISQGVSPDLRFGELPNSSVVLASADLNTRQPVYYGDNPHQYVLEGLPASTALPPWVPPLESEGRFLMDGGAISNLPVVPAISHGATEVIALGLSNPNEIDPEARGFGPFWGKLLATIERRQIYLELELARAKGVPVHVVDLQTDRPALLWDFKQTRFLLMDGHRQMQSVLASGEIPVARRRASWLNRLKRWFAVQTMGIGQSTR